MSLRIEELPRARLDEARALLGRACRFDPAAEVAEEKLFGPAPAPGVALGAFAGERLAGVAVAAGRWLRLLAVDPEARRRGAGGQLLGAVEARAPGKLRAGAQPGNYLAPGIDVRDEETRAWLGRRGYREVGRAENLVVPLAANPLVTAARAARLAEAARAAGYEVRRAGLADLPALRALAGERFSRAWAFELEQAVRHNEPPGVHLALRGDEPVAFAAHDGNNRGLGWFGPAGTDPEHRGRGLGAALLLACLLDIAAAGHDRAVIAWIGPRVFYQTQVGARADRQFVLLERDLL